MIYDNDIHALRSAFEDYKIAIPEPVNEAEALETAATQLVAQLSAASAPDLSGVTAETLGTVHQQMVAWPQTQRGIGAAQAIADHAHSQRLAAWRNASGVLMTGLRDPFNKVAKQFTATGNPDLANELESLANVRNLLADSGGPKASCRGTSNAEIVTRLVVPPSREAALNHVRRAHSRLHSAAWFLAVRKLGNVEFSWNTPAEQDAIWEQLPARNDDKAAAVFLDASIRRREEASARTEAAW